MRRVNSYKDPNTGIFTFQDSGKSSQIRSRTINGVPWLAASDVTKTLGYKNHSDAVKRHCKPRGIVKRDTPTESGIQSMNFINEPNVYRLISKSKLPSAEKFEKWVFEEVLPTIRKTGSYGNGLVMPDYHMRCIINVMNLDQGYFSVIHQMAQTVHAKLESMGYVIPDEAIDGTGIRPDVSVGLGFSKYLDDYYPGLKVARKKYPHRFKANGPSVQAWQYPDSVLELFRYYVLFEWIPEKASQYFKKRCPEALDYLPKLLPSGVKAK